MVIHYFNFIPFSKGLVYFVWLILYVSIFIDRQGFARRDIFSTPIVGNLVRRDCLPFVRPSTCNGNVAIAHYAIVWIGPTTKGVGTDDIAICIRYVNRFACGKGFVYFVWLILYVSIFIDRQGFARRDIFIAPIIGNLVSCDLLPFITPCAANGKVVFTHGTIFGIPTTKGVGTNNIAILIRYVNRFACGKGFVYFVWLSLYIGVAIDRQSNGFRNIATPFVGNAMLCHFYSLVVPFTGNHCIAITHLTVAGIGPTAKGVNADDIIIRIFFINLCFVGVGCIYCIRLTFHVVIAVCW